MTSETERPQEQSQSPSNGIAGSVRTTPEPATPEPASQMQLSDQKREFLRSRLVAANFGNVVTVLMNSAAHKDRPLSALQELIVPALISRQFRVAEAHKKDAGYTFPVGFVLWARVSKDVDARLSDTDCDDIKLSRKDWTSGNTFWLIEAVGEKRVLSNLLKDLSQSDFKGQQVKYRRKTDKGIEVAVLRS